MISNIRFFVMVSAGLVIASVLLLLIVALFQNHPSFANDAPLAPPPVQSAVELWSNPSPAPAFLNRIPAQLGALSGVFLYNFCLEVNGGILSEIDDREDDTVQSIRQTMALAVNGERVAAQWMSEPSNPIDHRPSRNSVVIVCHQLEGLDPGLHIATLRVESTAGREFTHAWAFEVPE